MKMAYADPPYLGAAKRYDGTHPDNRRWDDPAEHADLIRRLVAEFPDGWALSLSTPSLAAILPMCPAGVRVGAWVKPFAAFKVNVNPAYAWEPVIWSGGRKRGRDAATTRDWVAANITLRTGLCGAKPPEFCFWLFDVLGLEPGDDLHDLFPGTGAVMRSWRSYCRQRPLLFAEAGA
jgi:hypothetical protein